MTLEACFAKALRKRAKKGLRGYPVATIAFYGPDDSRASKVAVGIILREGGEAEILERWYTDVADARTDPHINEQILKFIRAHEVASVALVDRIIGCPNEEGIDYPEGEKCPECPFWSHPTAGQETSFIEKCAARRSTRTPSGGPSAGPVTPVDLWR
jgi:hypothetical protein